MWTKTLAALAAAIGVLWAAGNTPAMADVKDYEFELVQSELKRGDGAIVAVRLLNKKAGKPVPDAVVFAKRLDMAPDGMASMEESLDPLPMTEPGVYRFRTNLTMAGRWQLSLAAKVQGEEGTIETKLILQVLP